MVMRPFAATILIGAILLMLPVSNAMGRWTDPLTALFMATSATCVTGLSVVDISAHFSFFGQVILLSLIQLGGLGIMTLGTFFLAMVGRRLSVNEEFVMMDSLGTERVRGLHSLLAKTILFTLIIETGGAAILAYRFIVVHHYEAWDAVYMAFFHSISAFCNAGLSLFPNSLMDIRTDKIVILTVAALIILGGLGFFVLYNLSILRPWRRNILHRKRMALHTKLVLGCTAILLLVGWCAFLCLEWDNTLSRLTVADKFSCAFFQSATPRTAGFSVVNIADLNSSTFFMTIALMFIGGSSASTAGGVKTTTVVVLAMTMAAMIRGREETEIFRRTISTHVVREAITIFVLMLILIATAFGFLLVSERAGISSNPSLFSPQNLLFETVSATGTVGLSAGVTAALSGAGKLCIISCMFLGRIGTLVIALMIGRRDVGQAIRYPEEEITVG